MEKIHHPFWRKIEREDQRNASSDLGNRKGSFADDKNSDADANYGSEENYLYAIGEEKEQRFNYLIPYHIYLKRAHGLIRTTSDMQKTGCIWNTTMCPSAQTGGSWHFIPTETKRMLQALSKATRFTSAKSAPIAHWRVSAQKPKETGNSPYRALKRSTWNSESYLWLITSWNWRAYVGGFQRENR